MRAIALLLGATLAASGCDQTGTGFRLASAEVIPSELRLDSIGATAQLEARAIDRDGSPVFGARTSWSSADTAIATVDADGRVTAVSAGSTTVTANITGLQIVDVTASASVEVVSPQQDPS